MLAFIITFPPCSITTLYAVIGLPPSSVGVVHFTVSEVAWISLSAETIFGEFGASE